jgi:hypothetical protein
VLLAACTSSGDDAPTEQPFYPADYAATYTEVRDCRFSIDHDSQRVRVLADPAAVDTYTSRTGTFAPGAVILKEQYDKADMTCSGPIKQITVMKRLDGDWAWQRVLAGRVSVEDPTNCINCHADCGVPPVGFEGTCTAP